MIIRKLLTVILLLTLAFSQIACSNEAEKKEKHYQRALEYIKINDDKAAIIELKNAIQIDAKFADARYQLGLLYLKEGNPKTAFGELQRAFGIDGKNLDAGVKVAEFYLLSKDKEQSRKYVEQVLAVDPEYRDALALLANLELIEGNNDKALAAVSKALEKDPENDKLYNIKGRILMAQGSTAEAEQNFRKAISLNPSLLANYRILLMFYEQQNNESAITALLDEMKPKFPDDPQLHLLLAGVHLKRGEKDQAESEMLQVVQTQSTVANYRLMLADFYRKLNEPEKVKQVLEQAKTDFPDEIQIKTALAETYLDTREVEKAKTLMEEVLASNPGNGAANLLKARFLIIDGKNQQALELLTPLTTDYPKWADPFYYAALSYLRLGNAELAQKSIEMALQNAPAMDRYHALAAQIHLIRRNSEEATKEASIALRLNPRNAAAVKILAKSFVQGKQFDKVVKMITSLPPDLVDQDPELLDSLGMGYLGLKEKENAAKVFAKLLKLVPDNGNVLALMTALNTEGDIGKSIDYVKNHLQAHESAGSYLLLGDLLARNKQYDDALQAYNKAQELSPDNPQGYIKSARLLTQMGKTEETIQQFQTLLAKSPDSIPGLMGLAAAQEGSGNSEEAMKIYRRVLELVPDQPLASNNLAWLLASQKDADLGEALRLAMQAKQSLPDSPNVADTLGWVHLKRKSYFLAIPQFEQALQNQPESGIIRYHLALAQWGNEEKENALATIKEAIQKAENDKDKAEMEQTLASWEQEKQ